MTLNDIIMSRKQSPPSYSYVLVMRMDFLVYLSVCLSHNNG